MSYNINAYAIVQFSTAAITLALIYRVWKRRHIRGGKTLLLLFIAVWWWAMCTGFEAAAVDQSVKVLWSKISYIGAFFSPPLFLFFSLIYTNRQYSLTNLKITLVFLIPLAMIGLAFSNELHGLIWSGFETGPAGTNSLIYQHGYFYWVGMIYIFALVAFASFTLFVHSVKSQVLYQRQNRIILLASIFPIVSAVLYVSGLNPFPGLDITPVSFAFTAAALLMGISRQRFLDVIPISHEFLIDQFDDAVMVIDEGLRIIDLNQAAERMIIGEREKVIGKPGGDVIRFWDQLLQNFDPNHQLRFEIEQSQPEEMYFQTTISPLKNNQSQFMGWTLVIADITRRKAAEIALQDVNVKLENQLQEIRSLQEKLQEQAIRDAMTGAFNRGYLDETLERELARAKRNRYPLSVMMIDIDFFKKINDSYGHKAGDLVIKTVGKMLMNNSRACDCVCRFGGDEFVVVMPEMGEADAVIRAEKWRTLLKSKHMIFRNNTIAPTISIGIATYPNSEKSSRSIVDAADRALYAAKDSGRDCVRVFDS